MARPFSFQGTFHIIVKLLLAIAFVLAVLKLLGLVAIGWSPILLTAGVGAAIWVAAIVLVLGFAIIANK